MNMESVTSSNDTTNTTSATGSTCNSNNSISTTSTDIEASHGKENHHHQQLVQSTCDDNNYINHTNDVDVLDEPKMKNDETEDIECSCPICLYTASESFSSSNPRNAVATNSSCTGKNISSTTDTGNSDKEFVYSSTCGHIYCLPCIQHILLHSSSISSSKRTSEYSVKDLNSDDDNDDNARISPVITTTQGVCPICRAELSYFDLKKINIYMDENNNNNKSNKSSVKYKIVQSNETVVPKEEMEMLPKELLGMKYQASFKKSLTLVCRLQFPSDNYGTSSDIDDNLDKYITIRGIEKKEGDDQEVEHSCMKIDKFQYLPSTHTLKGWGEMYLQSTEKNGCTFDVQHCLWVTFSDNFQYVAHGISRGIQKACTCTTCIARHPNIDRGKVTVSVLGGDLRRDQMIRIDINPSRYIDPTSKQLVPRKPLRYKNSTLWGNIYCQELAIGFASFHFIRPPKTNKKDQAKNGIAFISYEHPMSSKYLPLDNGRPLPSRVNFHNIHCPDRYTFCGSICWEEDYGTTCHGSSRWDYKMIFDTKFTCIVSGTVHYVTSNDKKVVELKSIFGTDLIYANAGLYDSFTEHMVSKYGDHIRELKVGDKPGPVLDMVLQFSIYKCELISDRLRVENVTSETAFMILHILKAATYNVHNELLQILKEMPNSDIDAINSAMEKEYHENPIDRKYYYE